MTDHRPEPEPTADRLRRALHRRATTIDPSPDGLRHIEEKLMTERTVTDRQKWLIGGASAAAALLVAVLVFAAGDDDDTEIATATTETTTTTEAEPSTTTTTSTSSTTTTAAPFASEVDAFAVAFPSPADSRRFEAPESAAQAYASDVLGFTDLVLGEFREGDARSGEVVITDREGGPETRVLVRQMEDDTWFVLGSQTEDITVDDPAADDAVTSPFETSGSALAFEGTVEVIVMAQGGSRPLGTGFVTGSGTPPAGSFEGTIEFDPPTEETPGIVVYRTSSAEDGHVQQATSFAVRLQP